METNGLWKAQYLEPKGVNEHLQCVALCSPKPWASWSQIFPVIVICSHMLPTSPKCWHIGQRHRTPRPGLITPSLTPHLPSTKLIITRPSRLCAHCLGERGGHGTQKQHGVLSASGAQGAGVTRGHTTHGLSLTVMPTTSSCWVLARFPLPFWDMCAQSSVVKCLVPFPTSFEGKNCINIHMCKFHDPCRWPTWKVTKTHQTISKPISKPWQPPQPVSLGAGWMPGDVLELCRVYHRRSPLPAPSISRLYSALVWVRIFWLQVVGT